MRLLSTMFLLALAACGASAASTAGSGDAGAPALPPAVDASVGSSPSQGPADAKVTVIEFGDFECPFCGEEEPIVTQMLSDYSGRIRFVFKEFPLAEIHPYAEMAAQAALAANAQGDFWRYHNMLYANQSALTVPDLEGYAKTLGLDTTTFDAALTNQTYAAAVQADIDEGESLGVNGTPTFFINGVMVVGAVPYSDLESVINEELAKSP
jgi:protein-disulfide isomerase